MFRLEGNFYQIKWIKLTFISDLSDLSPGWFIFGSSDSVTTLIYIIALIWYDAACWFEILEGKILRKWKNLEHNRILNGIPWWAIFASDCNFWIYRWAMVVDVIVRFLRLNLWYFLLKNYEKYDLQMTMIPAMTLNFCN